MKNKILIYKKNEIIKRDIKKEKYGNLLFLFFIRNNFIFINSFIINNIRGNRFIDITNIIFINIIPIRIFTKVILSI